MPQSVFDALAPVAGLAVTLSDGVLSVTIDRPDSLNSLTIPVITALADTMECAADDPEVKVAEVDKVISKLLAGPVVAYAKTKNAINAATLTELDSALEREFHGQSVLLRSPDLIEGATAFQQRRTPKFTDR